MSRAAISYLLRLEQSNSKDHEVAVSRHADTPSRGTSVTAGISYPIHHSRGRETDPIRPVQATDLRQRPSWTPRVSMVRRRSTVRFRKGAPGQRQNSKDPNRPWGTIGGTK